MRPAFIGKSRDQVPLPAMDSGCHPIIASSRYAAQGEESGEEVAFIHLPVLNALGDHSANEGLLVAQCCSHTCSRGHVCWLSLSPTPLAFAHSRNAPSFLQRYSSYSHRACRLSMGEVVSQIHLIFCCRAVPDAYRAVVGRV